MKTKGLNKGTPGSMHKSFYQSKEYYDDADYEFPRQQRNSSPKEGKERRRSLGQNGQSPQQPLKSQASSRTRPTNNQLLYKAYFRWQHYSFKLRSSSTLLSETDACPSVTAAFLQVLQILHTAELYRIGQQRNILQILSTNTRRTKVVELSSGTHRVPDELKKHYLSDGEGGQYSTNLDRNRYGNDDNYLFTVIRYDLEYLGMCPCLVDVEIIDAKNNNQSVIVSAGCEACTCQKKDGAAPTANVSVSQAEEPAISNGVLRNPQTSNQPNSKCDSPKRSGSGVSQLFDALVMAATGGPEGAAVENIGGEPPVTSAYANTNTHLFHSLPQRQRSRLWSALSYGDVDSLQNALEAFRAEEEIASQPFQLSDALGQTESTMRHRKRKPPRHSSSILGRTTMDSNGPPGISALGKSGLNEKTDENNKQNDSAVGGPASPVESGEDDNEAMKAEDDDTEPELVSAGRMRHVPRQSSAVNLGTRVQHNAYAELKRVAAELESLKSENKRLENQLKASLRSDAVANVKKELEAERSKARQLETELNQCKNELQQANTARKHADERSAALTLEVASCRQQIQILISKLCSMPTVPAPVYNAPALTLPNVQSLCKDRKLDAAALSLPWLTQAPLLQQVLGHEAASLAPTLALSGGGSGRLTNSISNPLAALLSQSVPSSAGLQADPSATDIAALLWGVGSTGVPNPFARKADSANVPSREPTPAVGQGSSSPKGIPNLSPTASSDHGHVSSLISPKRPLEGAADSADEDKPSKRAILEAAEILAGSLGIDPQEAQRNQAKMDNMDNSD